jgi:N-acetylglucosaminyldiphosphoundecaprenol N-acetyl-beta-D-mannosaminyltransferase
MNRVKRRPAAKLLGISVEALDMELALSRIARELEARRKGYICMAGVHGIMEAYRDSELAAIYAGSSLTAPDGTPTVWVGRWQGHKAMQRVAGPELMLEVFRRKEFAGCTHFLYGGEEHVAEQLRERFTRSYPWARIVGTYTPPFRDLNAEEEESLIARVRKLKPDIIWVGISTPKQERFMHRYLHRLDTTLMFGVGAAYDFHTGRIQDAPQWIKTIGMQWLHRLLQDPRRLWKRYLRNNPAFLWHIALQLSGLRQYPPTRLEYLPAPLHSDRPSHADTVVGQLATPTAQLQQLGS